MKFFTFCLIFLALAGSPYDNANKLLISQVEFENGIYLHESKPITGEIIDYYENNILKFQYQVLEGRLHGEATEFFEDGSIKSHRNYTFSKLFGQFKEYYKTGELKVTFKVGLNAYGSGEQITNVKVAKGKGKKMKSLPDGILHFGNDSGNTLETSENISILKQNDYLILDGKGKELYNSSDK